MNILAVIGYNLRNLARFDGRDPRSRFWPYAAIVFVATMGAEWLTMMPELRSSLERMQRFAIEHPELATIESGHGNYSISIRGFHPELMPRIENIAAGFGVVTAITIVLLAAAVARRLHDRGRTGDWGLLPLPFLALGFALMAKLFALGSFDWGLFFAAFASNALYLASLLVLVILLAGAGEANDNRYGDKPAGNPPPIPRL